MESKARLIENLMWKDFKWGSKPETLSHNLLSKRLLSSTSDSSGAAVSYWRKYELSLKYWLNISSKFE